MKDACEGCEGRKGGVPGNENLLDGVPVCDYCSAAHMKIREPFRVKREKHFDVYHTYSVWSAWVGQHLLSRGGFEYCVKVCVELEAEIAKHYDRLY